MSRLPAGSTGARLDNPWSRVYNRANRRVAQWSGIGRAPIRSRTGSTSCTTFALSAGSAGCAPRAERFVFSLDGGAFLACDAARTDFFRQTLRQQIEQLTRDQVQRAKEQEQRDRQIDRRLILIAGVMGVPSLVFFFLAAVPGIKDLPESAGYTLLWGLFALLIGLLIYGLATRSNAG